jgi:co-chaperonin GroES (HSP10)
MDKLVVTNNRKFNDLALREQWKMGGEFDPETNAPSEWKEKIAEKGFRYGKPQPLLFNVLIRQHGAEHHAYAKGFTDRIIEIPRGYQNKPGVGIVVAIGSSVPSDELKLGDMVKFGLLSEEVEFDGEKFQLVDFRNIKYREPVYKVEVESEDV